MNKAKMTFQFSEQNRRRHTPSQNVISLDTSDYRVWEENDSPLKKDRQVKGFSKGPSDMERRERQIREALTKDLFQSQGLNEYTSDFGSWQSPFSVEAERIQRQVREGQGNMPEQEQIVSDEDKPPAQEQPSFHTERSGVYTEQRFYDSFDTPRIVRRSGGFRSWMKMITSVTGAVIVGILFGFLVLGMFSNYGQEDAGKAVQAAEDVSQPSIPAQTPASNGLLSISLPDRSYALLQGGVFSTAEGAATAQADFHRQGLAAATYSAAEKFPVYVALSISRDEALALTQTFKEKQVEVLVKTVDLPAVTQVKWSGADSQPLQDYISYGAQAIEGIAKLTAVHALEAKPTALEDNLMKKIQTAHQGWLAQSNVVASSLDVSLQPFQQTMNSSLNMAVLSLGEYKKNPSQSFIWQAQTAAMQYVLAEKQLRDAAAVL